MFDLSAEVRRSAVEQNLQSFFPLNNINASVEPAIQDAALPGMNFCKSDIS